MNFNFFKPRQESNIPEIKISLRYDKKIPFEQMETIDSSEKMNHVFRKVFSKDTFGWTEEMIMICLNQSGKVIGFYKVSSGGLTGTVADPKVIFTVALNCAATKIIIAHNHPSGNLKPSRQDEELTIKIKEGGKLLSIELLDHIILTEEGYYSFADTGLL